MEEIGHDQLMRYLDGELSPEERSRVEAALERSTEAQRELAIFRALKNDLSGLGFVADADDGLWGRVNRRVTRPLGWLLFLIGVVLWLGYGSYVFVTTPGELVPKLAIGAVVIGLVLLLVSVARDQYRAWIREPYRSVQR
jgi:ferric-dicitrate binding protein FerR (iron transport regulator)